MCERETDERIFVHPVASFLRQYPYVRCSLPLKVLLDTQTLSVPKRKVTASLLMEIGHPKTKAASSLFVAARTANDVLSPFVGSFTQELPNELPNNNKIRPHRPKGLELFRDLGPTHFTRPRCVRVTIFRGAGFTFSRA